MCNLDDISKFNHIPEKDGESIPFKEVLEELGLPIDIGLKEKYVLKNEPDNKGGKLLKK